MAGKSRAYEAVEVYTKWLHKLKYVVFLFWLGILVVGVMKGFDLLGATTFEAGDIDTSTASWIAADHIAHAFPAQVLTDINAILIRPPATGAASDAITTPEHVAMIEQFAMQLGQNQCISSVEGPTSVWATTEIGDDNCKWPCENTTCPTKADVMSTPKEQRWGRWDNPDCDSGCKFDDCADTPCCVNPISRGGVIECAVRNNITYGIGSENSVMINATAYSDKGWLVDMVDQLAAIVNAESSSPLQFTPTGTWFISDPLADALENALVLGDAISIPTALAVLAITLQSARFVVVPIFSIALSILFSFLLVLAIAVPEDENGDIKNHVSSVAPNLMMSVAIAMSVDYSLFMLSRWNEEIKLGRDLFEATVIAMYHTGHTILVSGFTLAACCMGLMLIPLDLLSSLGFSASIVVGCTMIINLTLTPAMLLWNPCGFFSGAAAAKNCQYDCGGSARAKQAGVRARGIAPDDEDDDARLLEDDEDDVGLVSWDPAVSGRALSSALSAQSVGGGGGDNADFVSSSSLSTSGDDVIHRRELEQLRKSAWYKFGTYLTTGWRSIAAIVVIVGLAAGLAHLSISFNPIGGNTLCFADQKENHTASIQDIGSVFGFSKIAPYGLLVQRDENSTVRLPSDVDLANATEASIKLLLADLKECVDLSPINLLAIVKTHTVQCTSDTDLCVDACNVANDLLRIYFDMETLYTTVSTLVPRFVKEVGVKNSSVAGIGWNKNQGVFDPFSDVVAQLGQCIDTNKMATNQTVSCKGGEECQSFCLSAIQFIYLPVGNYTTDPNFYRLKLLVELGISSHPLSAVGIEWLTNAREVLEGEFDHESTNATVPAGVEGWLGIFSDGDYDKRIDSMRVVYNAFPLSVGYVAAIVFILMGVSFGSVVIALTAVLSIGLTLSIVYGFTTAVYQNGIFAGLHTAALSSSEGLCWVPPVLCFSLLVGLGLDYHIFLLNRVVEYRMRGYPDNEAVVLGLARTGGVITAAGIIMAVAFLGTMVAPQPVLYQLSFFIIIAVLTDTFIVRAMLVPAMMVTLGKYNWWPRKMPPIRPELMNKLNSGGMELLNKLNRKASTMSALELEDEYNQL